MKAQKQSLIHVPVTLTDAENAFDTRTARSQSKDRMSKFCDYLPILG